MPKTLIRNFIAASTAVVTLASCNTPPCKCAAAANSNVEPHLTIQLPPEFSCKLESADHVCQTADHSKFVIYTLKATSGADSLENYQSHLTNPKIVEINGQKWVDAVRTDGELPGSSTRYLATVEGDIAVLVTFTAKKADFAKFMATLRPAIGSLILRR